MRLRNKLLPRWYDLGQLLLQEQLYKMFRRFLRIQRTMRSSLDSMPIRFGLEYQQWMHSNFKHLPNWSLLQWCKVHSLSILWKRKSLEWYSQSMRLPTKLFLEWRTMYQMRHWPALCNWRLLLPIRNFLWRNSMFSQNKWQMHRYSKFKLERNSLRLLPRFLNQRWLMFLWRYSHWRLLRTMRLQTKLSLDQRHLPMQQRLRQLKWCLHSENCCQCLMQCWYFLR